MTEAGANVLLVDDDDELRDLIADVLIAEGHTVRIAGDGVEALKELDHRFPQLVISDLEMPVLDGKAFVSRMFIEDLGRENIPVIMMSASDHLPEVARAIGTPYALAKPFTVRALREIVVRALAEGIPPQPPDLTGLR